MKSRLSAFPLFILAKIVLLHTLALAQQLNPPPDACCECLELIAYGVNDKQRTPLSPDDSIPFDKDGTAKVAVQIRHNGNPGCPSQLKVNLIARPAGTSKGDHSMTKTLTVGANSTSAEQIFTLTKADERLSQKWEIDYVCDDGSSSSNGQHPCNKPYKFTLGKECKSCSASCPSDGNGNSGDPSVNENGNIDIAATMYDGDVEAYIRYLAGGLDDDNELSNPGILGLVTFLPSSAPVTRNPATGKITAITAGTTLIEITPAAPALLAEDPNAFVITHKNTSSSAPQFRTTTISLVSQGGLKRLRCDSFFAGATMRYEQYKTSSGTRILEIGRMIGGEPAPLRQITYARTTPAPGKMIYRITTKERASIDIGWELPSTTTSDIETTYENQIHGWAITKQVIDPSSAALTSTWSYYQPGETTGVSVTDIVMPGIGGIPHVDSPPSYHGVGRLKHHSRYDGYEAFYSYSFNVASIAMPYAGNPSGKVTTIVWNPGSQTETTTTRVNGVVASQKSSIHSPTTLVLPRKLSSGGAVLTKSNKYRTCGINLDFGGKVELLQHEDGTITTYSYTRHSGGGYTTTADTGFSEDGATVVQGRRTITTVSSRGTVIAQQTKAIGYDTHQSHFDSMAVIETDIIGRPVTTAYHPETISISGETVSASNPAWITTTQYTCCGIASQTDKYGVTTFYAYDGLQRQIKSNSLGVTTETKYKGLTVETHRYTEAAVTSVPVLPLANAATIISKSVRNLSGTLQESWSPNPTSTSAGTLVRSSMSTSTYLNTQSQYLPYDLGKGIGQRSTTTTADGSTQTTDSFLDGRTAKTYGALSPAMEYAYTVNTTGEVTSQSYADGANLGETTSTQTDWDGRTLRIDYMDGSFATMEYNTKGQMVKSTDPDGVISLIAYNAVGEQTITAIDLNRNGAIDYGSDTVQFSETIPALDAADKPVWKSISKIWQPGDTSPTGGTIVSTSLQSANGLSSASQSIGTANASTSLTTLGGNGNWTITSTSPDGTKSLNTYTAGRMVSMTRLTTNNAVIESQTQGYDSLNRPTISTHSRSGSSTTTYLSSTADMVKNVSDAANRTTAFVYDIRGRQISVDAPNTVDANNQPLPNVTTTTYNPDNTVAETNGDQTYRVSHTYDYADRQISMTTYGTATATTTWQYSTTRGFLMAKRDAANKAVTYTRSAAGRLTSRTWARGVSTTYSLDNGGRMVATNYSDTTPDVTIAYDAIGRQTTQSNGVARSTFTYNSSNLQIDSETIAYDLNADNTIDFTRVIDRSQDSLNRESGWQLKVGTTVENEVAYAYGTTDGRLSSVSKGANSFGYTYVPNSNLPATFTSPVHTVSNVYETTRDVLASKVNKVGTTTISGYFYTVNNYGQRTGVNKDGTAFASTRTIAWGYNTKGEVVKADSSITGHDRSYQYDGIGNRLKSAESLTLPSANNYTPNKLNQYTAMNSLTPVHDDDGNMTSGPLPANVNANSNLVWDAENRLIEAQAAGTSVTLVRYAYDAQSRRIAETVGSATTIYVYDGWNPIAEYNTTYALTKTYIWGMDLSGSMQGAGGVGGLLSVTDGTGTYFPTFDGNGNVSEYLDSTGNIVAHYEYDPFGKTIVATGSKANDFAHRFSTKPLDLTTGLYYYGYRFYDPETGRWPSRDPIGESGGINLYGFGPNRPVKGYDILGNRWSEEDANSGLSPGTVVHEPFLGPKDANTFELTRALKARATLCL